MRSRFYFDDNYGLKGEASAHLRDRHVILLFPKWAKASKTSSARWYLSILHLYGGCYCCRRGSKWVKLKHKSYKTHYLVRHMIKWKEKCSKSGNKSSSRLNVIRIDLSQSHPQFFNEQADKAIPQMAVKIDPRASVGDRKVLCSQPTSHSSAASDI
ncbi:hypothetical protein N7491_004793 [Penicillium cf. griseofulvum]|uniref:Uncharacterized protein n=1 Tax=Penicillium cf. griseofulvum TaxID=2972120 RepID=A0A9W9M4C1_9EURO|nr:hypothetical protein N7472_007482 [Penicillium cf. griseofulvum]KAJ5434198.1 hypothetical protein N7491_004793 [Penicillium cf. griseofulvum]KAJ5452023.1 hypothetical protein N7445_000206 [Penicillium cf. griseofulvum]